MILLRAIKDFDSVLSEFNQLTASVRQNDEDEEAKEEETVAYVSDKYDRFNDVTAVSTSKLLVRGSKRSIHISAGYKFSGKRLTKPERISLYFYTSAKRPMFRDNEQNLTFLVDDKRVPLGTARISDEEETKIGVKQTVTVSIPYETLVQIVTGKNAEFKLGDLEYKLTEKHLQAFKMLLAYKD